MNKGDKIIYDDLVIMRPFSGINPMEIDKVLDKVLKNDIPYGTSLKWKDIK